MFGKVTLKCELLYFTVQVTYGLFFLIIPYKLLFIVCTILILLVGALVSCVSRNSMIHQGPLRTTKTTKNNQEPQRFTKNHNNRTRTTRKITKMHQKPPSRVAKCCKLCEPGLGLKKIWIV